MRLFACFLVVLTHSVMNNKPENGVWNALISFICSPSSEMFLMLSGAILLPVKTDMNAFYKRRFTKLLPPMIVWSVFCLVLRYCQGRIDGYEMLIKFLLIPLKPTNGVYWFLYVMIGLYLFAPIISYWLKQATKRQVEIFLGLWLINMLIPFLNLFIPEFYNQNGSYYWPLCYFGGFLGYWILGYYLKKFPPQLRSFAGYFAIIGILIYTALIFYIKLKDIDSKQYTDNLQIGSVFFIILFFIMIKRFAETTIFRKYINERAANIAQYSFGIYLLHIFVIRDGVWLFMENNRIYDHPILESLFIAILSMTLCVLIMKILTFSYKPFGKWLFGLK